MVANLNKAIEIATFAHENQERFDGSHYINHPMRVMRMLEIQGHSEQAQMVGVLHDSLEDTAHNVDDARVTIPLLQAEGFDDYVTIPLELLTKGDDDKVDYDTYIARLAVNACSRAVKRDDLFDNMELTGLVNPSRERILTIEKYGRALLFLARFPQPRV